MISYEDRMDIDPQVRAILFPLYPLVVCSLMYNDYALPSRAFFPQSSPNGSRNYPLTQVTILLTCLLMIKWSLCKWVSMFDINHMAVIFRTPSAPKALDVQKRLAQESANNVRSILSIP